MSGDTEWLFEDHTAIRVVLAGTCKTRAETAYRKLGYLTSSMNSFLFKKKRFIILFYCVYVWGWGVHVSASFPEAIRGSEPLELEGGSEPYDKGAGNQIQVLCKSSAHAELPLQPCLSNFL